MKKVVSIGLFALLAYHTLAYVLVFVGSWWQEKHDLSERLLVYHSVDSIVEFEIPLNNKGEATSITRTTSDGFTYRGQYYSVVSIDVEGDTLHIAGLPSADDSFWQSDLLTFMQEHVTASGDSPKKANTLLKFLLKEYPPASRVAFHFQSPDWRDDVRIPERSFSFYQVTRRISSPPPEA